MDRFLQNFEKYVIETLGSKMFIFLVTIAALIPMINHTKIVYEQATGITNEFMSIMYAAVLDSVTLLAVLMSTGTDRKISWWSVVFAFVGLLVNITFLFDVPDWAAKAIISFVLPATITYLSHAIRNIRRDYKSALYLKRESEQKLPILK